MSYIQKIVPKMWAMKWDNDLNKLEGFLQGTGYQFTVRKDSIIIDHRAEKNPIVVVNRGVNSLWLVFNGDAVISVPENLFYEKFNILH